MFIFRLLNIIVGQKVSHNDKARSLARKGLRKLRISELKKCMFYKGLIFISKELQLIQKITINKAFLRRSLHRRRLRSANPSQGKNHKKGKEKRKEKEKKE